MWTEKTLSLKYRYADGKPERLPGLAAELIRLKVVLVATGAPAAHAAKTATSTIPIVMRMRRSGWYWARRQPGATWGDITGLSDFNSRVITKRLELLKEAVPRVSRVAVLLNPANPHEPAPIEGRPGRSASFGCDTALPGGQRS